MPRLGPPQSGLHSKTRKINVRGWPCEVDAAPLRGRDGESESRRRPRIGVLFLKVHVFLRSIGARGRK